MKNFFFVISFQDPATVFSYHLIAVHNDIFWFILIILVSVYWCLYKIIREFGWEVFNKRGFLIKYISSFVQTHYLFVTWVLYRVRTVRLILPMYYSLVALAIDKHLLLKENDIISFLIFKIFRVVFLQIGDVYFKGMEFPYEIELLELKDVKELQNRQSIAIKLFYESTWARLLGDLTRNVLYSLRFRKNMLLEYIYSIVPTAIIIWILMPSFVLLYSLDEAIDPLLTIKVEGHQWFWHYEFSNFIAVDDDKEEILKIIDDKEEILKIVDEAAKVYNAYLNGDEKALERDLSDFWSLNNRINIDKSLDKKEILKIVDEAAKVYNAYLNGDEKALERDLSDFWSLNNRINIDKSLDKKEILKIVDEAAKVYNAYLNGDEKALERDLSDFWSLNNRINIDKSLDKKEILKIVDEAAKVYNAYLNGDEKALERDLSDFWSLNDSISTYKEVSYDSVLVSDQDLPFGSKRLLTVDKPLFVPMDISIRFLISSADVLHAWSVPEFGLKIDAVPGRLNQFITMVCKPGVYYGQCSELCGVAHGYMPIQVIAVSLYDWLDFVDNVEKLNYV